MKLSAFGANEASEGADQTLLDHTFFACRPLKADRTSCFTLRTCQNDRTLSRLAVLGIMRSAGIRAFTAQFHERVEGV